MLKKHGEMGAKWIGISRILHLTCKPHAGPHSSPLAVLVSTHQSGRGLYEVFAFSLNGKAHTTTGSGGVFYNQMSLVDGRF